MNRTENANAAIESAALDKLLADIEAHGGEMVDELTYRNYAHNRLRHPHVLPEQWAAIFSNVEAMEARYQRELDSVGECGCGGMLRRMAMRTQSEREPLRGKCDECGHTQTLWETA